MTWASDWLKAQKGFADRFIFMEIIESFDKLAH